MKTLKNQYKLCIKKSKNKSLSNKKKSLSNKKQLEKVGGMYNFETEKISFSQSSNGESSFIDNQSQDKLFYEQSSFNNENIFRLENKNKWFSELNSLNINGNTNPNLYSYFNNMINGNLLFLDTHSSLHNSVFKTRLTIIFLEQLDMSTPTDESLQLVQSLRHRIIDINNNNNYYKMAGNSRSFSKGSEFYIRGKEINNKSISLRIHLPNTLINNQSISMHSYHDLREQYFSPAYLCDWKNIEYYNKLVRKWKKETTNTSQNYDQYFKNNKYLLFNDNNMLPEELYQYSDITLAEICKNLEDKGFFGTIIFDGCRGVESKRQLELSRITSSLNPSFEEMIDYSDNIHNQQLSNWIQQNIQELFIHNLENDKLVEKLDLNINKNYLEYDELYRKFRLVNSILSTIGLPNIPKNYFIDYLSVNCNYYYCFKNGRIINSFLRRLILYILNDRISQNNNPNCESMHIANFDDNSLNFVKNSTLSHLQIKPKNSNKLLIRSPSRKHYMDYNTGEYVPLNPQILKDFPENLHDIIDGMLESFDTNYQFNNSSNNDNIYNNDRNITIKQHIEINHNKNKFILKFLNSKYNIHGKKILSFEFIPKTIAITIELPKTDDFKRQRMIMHRVSETETFGTLINWTNNYILKKFGKNVPSIKALSYNDSELNNDELIFERLGSSKDYNKVYAILHSTKKNTTFSRLEQPIESVSVSNFKSYHEIDKVLNIYIGNHEDIKKRNGKKYYIGKNAKNKKQILYRWVKSN